LNSNQALSGMPNKIEGGDDLDVKVSAPPDAITPYDAPG
jgi:hypothetical protein